MVIGYISYLGYSTSLPPPIFNGLYFSLALKYPRSTVQTGVWFTQLTKASLSILAQQYYWYEAFVTCNLAVSWNHFTELLLPCALYWYGIGTTKQGSWRKAYLSPFSLSLSETSLDPARSNKISALSLQRGIYSCLFRSVLQLTDHFYDGLMCVVFAGVVAVVLGPYGRKGRSFTPKRNFNDKLHSILYSDFCLLAVNGLC